MNSDPPEWWPTEESVRAIVEVVGLTVDEISPQEAHAIDAIYERCIQRALLSQAIQLVGDHRAV